MTRWRTPILLGRLALADLSYEWRMTTCFVIGLAAVLAPLMVLFGLKFGVVDILTARLEQEPENRRLVPVGAGHHEAAFFAALGARPETGFVVASTRQIAAVIDAARSGDVGAPSLGLELVPTAPGDPLAAPGTGLADGFTSVSLSSRAARKLGVVPGDALDAVVTRTFEGRPERATMQLTVSTILPEASFGRDAAFVSLDLLAAIERYRDGVAVPTLGWSGRPAPAVPPPFASFRLYARTIRDVAPLAHWLAEQGIEVQTQAAAIESVLMLDRNLTAIFLIVAAIAGVGLVLSLGASLWGNVERKRRDLAILALLGIGRAGIAAFPALEAGAIAVAGVLVSSALFLVAAACINAYFSASLPGGAAACTLRAAHFAVAALVSLTGALAAASLAGWHASRIDPSESLRDV
jgi:putative ABC transport system permease protein